MSAVSTLAVRKAHGAVYAATIAYQTTAHHGQDNRKAFLDILRRHYPAYHLTSVNDFQRSEFLEFANAGRATATLGFSNPDCGDCGDGDRDRELDYGHDHGFDHVVRHREYKHPKGGRVRRSQGSVISEVPFGVWRYVWSGKQFWLYRFEWRGFYDQPMPVWFVLYPLAEATVDSEGNCAESDALIAEIGKWSAVPHEDVYVFDDGRVRRSRELWLAIKDSVWEDVVMDPVVKSRLMRDVASFFSNETRDIYAKYQIPYKRGVLMHGPPGNGKTSIVKALVAHLMRLDEPIPSLYVKSTTNKCSGDHVSIQHIFKHARRMAPCCIVLEDLDSLINDPKVRSYFLNEMDGLEDNDGILIIGSTNHLDGIDEAIRSRPSRFDRKYHFDIPKRSERELYAKYWCDKLAGNDDVDFSVEMCPLIAELTDGFSYAYMKELFASSLVMIARNGMGEELDWDIISAQSAEPSEVCEETGDRAGDEGNTKQSEKIHKGKREIPNIELPDSLKDNLFFKLIEMNATILIKDMEVAKHAEVLKHEKKDKKKPPFLNKDNDRSDTKCASC